MVFQPELMRPFSFQDQAYFQTPNDVSPRQVYKIVLYDNWVFNMIHILATLRKHQPDTTAAETDPLLHQHFLLPAVIRS